MNWQKPLIVGLCVVAAFLLFGTFASGQPLSTPSDATPSPSTTSTPDTTSTPTLTPTPADITLTGQVTDASTGLGIPDATVLVTSCFPRAYSATTDADGRYSLFLPGFYFPCGLAPLKVSAAGYLPFEHTYTTDDLRQHPARDFALAPGYRIYLPLVSGKASSGDAALGDEE
ncbi:MAG: carboxypeptidase-like regulatory domain-containing protein [Anaerolineae bacterium]